MVEKLINYISMLEKEIEWIKEEYYSPDQVRAKEKYFRDETWKYRVEIKRLKEEDAESMGWIEQYKSGCENYRSEIKRLKSIIKENGAELDVQDAEITELKDKLERQKRELLDEIRYGAGI